MILTVCLAWFALGYWALGLAPSYAILVVLAGAMGGGAGLWHPPALSLLSRAYPDRRGLALSLHEVAGNFGAFLAPIVVGSVLLLVHWRTVLLAHLIPGLAVAMVFLIGIGRLPRPESGLAAPRHYLAGLWSLVTNRTISGMSLVSALRTASQNTIMTFLPLFLSTHHLADARQVGLYVGILSSLGIFSPMISGPISDRLGRRPVLLVGLGLSALAAAAVPYAPPGPLLLGALALLGLVLLALRSVIFACALDVAPSALGGSTVGLLFGIQSLAAALSPSLLGALADQVGLQLVLSCAAALALAALVVAAAVGGRGESLSTAPHPT
jgi:MFS family permease